MEKVIIANWKQHPATLGQAQELFKSEVVAAEQYPNLRTIICPPKEFILAFAGASQLGAQDIFWQSGESNLGVRFVLVGHSDRRATGDTNEIINQKLKFLLEAEITPVLLIGERERGADRKAVLEEQLNEAMTGLTNAQALKVLICYEPVWAISRPRADVAGSVDNVPAEVVFSPDTPDSTLEAIKIINDILAVSHKLSDVSCLYGGSVNAANISSFLSHREISGAVIGRASLDPEQWAKMLQISAGLQDL